MGPLSLAADEDGNVLPWVASVVPGPSAEATVGIRLRGCDRRRGMVGLIPKELP
ncbi:hypothetical protein IPV09_13535 [Tessaracoccus sp. SD287]|uniref:hypothetical protein n=1 Tax=Tessaracoccus sp. SD287 TaxID=2782008 RepID=UPI001A95E840|nr:hypothetical protein [Tessaracoccus sp. SD287]MBO1032356.1 hypothetical protein [Tessaracoccus sp. SD287]